MQVRFVAYWVLLMTLAGCCGAYGQNTAGSGASTVYLYDLTPIKIDGGRAVEIVLARDWRIGKFILGKKEYKKSISFGGINASLIAGGGNYTFSAEGYDLFEADLIVHMKRHPGERDRASTCTGSFAVLGDGKRLAPIPFELEFDTPYHLAVPLKGVSELTLKYDVRNARANDVWWADARLVKRAAARPTANEGGSESVSPSDSQDASGGTAGGEVFSFEIRDIEDLAKNLKLQVEEDKAQFKTRPVQVAIASFELIPKALSPDNARKVREQLTVALIKTKAFQVIERSQLDKILEELKRGQADITDVNTAQALGKQINARTVLIGSISDEQTHIIINTRLINTETGESTIAESIEVKKH